MAMRKEDYSDVILATRVKILRNIKGFSFPLKMSIEEKENLIGMTRQALAKEKYSFARGDEIDKDEKKRLFEDWAMTKSFVQDGKGKALLVSEDEKIKVFINDVDHVGIQSMDVGRGNIKGTYDKAEAVAVNIEKAMDIAYSERLGFLTANPNNTGSGCRIAFLVSIPGIVKAGVLPQFINKISKFDWTLIPAFQTKPNRDVFLYILANIATLGITENALLVGADYITKELVKAERACRAGLYRKNTNVIEEQYYRAFGVLRYARKISRGEAIALISWLWIGQGKCKGYEELGLTWDKIYKVTKYVCCELIQRPPIQSVNIMGVGDKECSDRANIIRSILKGDESV